MSRQLFLSALAGWPVVVLAALSARAAFVSAEISGTEYAGWLFLSCGPGAIALTIVRGLPSPSMTQVLYDTERTGVSGPGRSVRRSVDSAP